MFLQASLTIPAMCFYHHILPPHAFPLHPAGSFCGCSSPTHTTAVRALSSSSLAVEGGRASFPHKGLAGLADATAAFVTDIHSRSVEATNATRTRLLYVVEPDLQGLSSSPAFWLVLQTQKCAPGVPHSLVPCSWQILPKALTKYGACAIADLWAHSLTFALLHELVWQSNSQESEIQCISAIVNKPTFISPIIKSEQVLLIINSVLKIPNNQSLISTRDN